MQRRSRFNAEKKVKDRKPSRSSPKQRPVGWLSSRAEWPLGVKLVSCGYRNSSDRMVIARCLGPDQFFMERVVFPFELLSFQCPDQSELEIWTHGLGGAELVETIPVADLFIEDPNDGPAPFGVRAGSNAEAA